jgi:hypothetical protein
LTIHYFTLALVMSAYMAITIYLLMVIWPDEHMHWRGKIKATLYVPFLYFIFYIMNAVQLISVIRCIKNHKAVTDLSAGHSGWTSPERAGGAATFS